MLTRQDFSNSEIMSISGHKSVQSLTIYQKTAPKQKLEMGNILFQSVTKPEDEITRPSKSNDNKMQQLTAPSPLKALPAPTSMEIVVAQKENTFKETIPFDNYFDNEDSVTDMDLLSAL